MLIKFLGNINNVHFIERIFLDITLFSINLIKSYKIISEIFVHWLFYVKKKEFPDILKHASVKENVLENVSLKAPGKFFIEKIQFSTSKKIAQLNKFLKISVFITYIL